MQAPNSEYLQAIKRILRYVKGTSQFSLRLLARSPLRLYGFSNADWESCATTMRIFSIHRSKFHFLGIYKATYSIKVECWGRVQGTSFYSSKTYMDNLLRDIGVYLKAIPTMHCDNIYALYMTVNLFLHARSNMWKWIIKLLGKKWHEDILWYILFNQRTRISHQDLDQWRVCQI